MNKQELKNIIGQAKVILDIGSYDGKDARELHELFGCDVHCFEPNEEVFIHGPGLVYYPVAVSNHYEETTYFKTNHQQSGSIKKPFNHKQIWPDIHFGATTKIRSITLDTWWNGCPIDLIWCDANGSEADVIEGGRNTLSSTRFLYIEVSDKELYAGQPKINEVIAMLPDFKVIGLYDFGENFSNILFKNTKL